MRIGNQPQPISVARQQRTRTAEASGSMAKAAPRFQVGRVAAFVQHINNGTFGSADTRAFKSSAKPAAFAGSPMTAGAPVVRAAPATERMPVLPPLKSPAMVLALTGVVNRGGEGSQSSSCVVHPSIVGKWKDVASTQLPDVSKPNTDARPTHLSGSHVRPSRYVKRTDVKSRPPRVNVLPSRFQRRGQTLQPVAARPLRPQHDAELPPRLKEVHLLALLPEAKPLLPLSPDAGPDRLDRAGMTYVCFDSDDEGLGGFDTDWDSESEWGGDSDMDADVDLGYSANRIRTVETVDTSVYRRDETEQLRQDVVRYRTELEAYDELTDATKNSLATRLSSVGSIKVDEAVTAVYDSRDEASLNDALIRAFVQQRRQESLYVDSSSDSDSDSDLDQEWDYQT